MGLSVLTGVLYGMASPRIHFHFLSWILLVPLLWAIEDRPPKQAFHLGWIAGIFTHLLCFYWIAGTVQRYSNLHSALSLLALVLFSFYSGLPFGMIASLTSFLRARTRLPVIILFPVFYTAMEYLYPFIFPWHLGASQYGLLPVIQISDIFGVYGVTTLVVIVNCAVFQIVRSLIRNTSFPWIPSLSALILVAATIAYGGSRVRHVESRIAQGEALTVGIVQPNVLLEERQSPFLVEDIAHRYARLSDKASVDGAQLIVWPESALAYMFQPQSGPSSPSGRLKSYAKDLQAALVFGTIAAETDGLRNTAYLINPQGRTAGRYDKVHLLAFGEYMPFSNWIPHLNGLVQGVGNFKPGERIDPLCWDHTCFGVLICYEAILKDLARAMVKGGAQFLVNITNDAWFGDTRCPEQHLMLASFRAVENRVYLLRSANTGISAVVDPVGRISARTTLFTEALRVETIRLVSITSLYQKWGDWFARLCSITMCALACISVIMWWNERTRR
jgi:apolipoprotein N-acyltransferase